MATKPLVYVDGEIGRWARYKWEGLANDDDGAALEIDRLAAGVEIQAIGADFGGGTLSVRGAIDDVPTYADEPDPGGNVIALAAAGRAALRDQPLRISPKLAGGADGDVDVWALVRFAGV